MLVCVSAAAAGFTDFWLVFYFVLTLRHINHFAGALLEVNFKGDKVSVGRNKEEELPALLKNLGWMKVRVIETDSENPKYLNVDVLDVPDRSRRRGGRRKTKTLRARIRLRSKQEKTSGLERVVLTNEVPKDGECVQRGARREGARERGGGALRARAPVSRTRSIYIAPVRLQLR